MRFYWVEFINQGSNEGPAMVYTEYVDGLDKDTKLMAHIPTASRFEYLIEDIAKVESEAFDYPMESGSYVFMCGADWQSKQDGVIIDGLMCDLQDKFELTRDERKLLNERTLCLDATQNKLKSLEIENQLLRDAAHNSREKCIDLMSRVDEFEKIKADHLETIKQLKSRLPICPVMK